MRCLYGVKETNSADGVLVKPNQSGLSAKKERTEAG